MFLLINCDCYKLANLDKLNYQGKSQEKNLNRIEIFARFEFESGSKAASSRSESGVRSEE